MRDDAKVVQISDANQVEMMRRFGITREELKDAIKPTFLWMYDHGITDLRIARKDQKDTQPEITIDGRRMAEPTK